MRIVVVVVVHVLVGTKLNYLRRLWCISAVDVLLLVVVLVVVVVWTQLNYLRHLWCS